MIEKILIAVRNDIDFEKVCQGSCKVPNLFNKGEYFCSVYRNYPQIKCNELHLVGKSAICWYKEK